MELKDVIRVMTNDDVVSVYSGKAHHCCCGCSGKHSYNSKFVAEGSRLRGYKVDREEVNDKQITRVVNLVKENVAIAQGSDDKRHVGRREWVSVIINERLYVVYFRPGHPKAKAVDDSYVQLAAR